MQIFMKDDITKETYESFANFSKLDLSETLIKQYFSFNLFFLERDFIFT